MTVAHIHHHAQAFQQNVHRRNIREYGASVIAALVLIVGMWALPHSLMRVGSLVTLLGLCYVAFDLRRSGAARELPGGGSAIDCLAFHRRELGRQRDVLRRAGTIHIAALLPGVATICAGNWLLAQRWLEARPEPMAIWLLSIAWGFALAVLALVSWGNLHEARRLQRDIDALDG